MQLKNKIVGILIVLCCAMNVLAWTDEIGLYSENESCEFNVNPIFNGSTVDNPYWLDYTRYVHNPGNGILDPALRSRDQIDFQKDYNICKYIYNPTTKTYEKTACCITISEVITLVIDYDSNGDAYYRCPDNLLSTHLTDAKLIQRYYQEMINSGQIDCSTYTNVDEAGNGNPDVFGINATADVGNDDLNQVYTGFVALTGDDEREVMAGMEYGFDMGSISGEGGSGDLANSVGWGKMDGTSKEHMDSFHIFFYTLIPIIFILLVMKMLGKVSN